MDFKSRKLYIGFVSLGAVFVVYLVYNLVSETPLFDVDSELLLKEQPAESNDGWTGGEVGSIGGVGVERLKGVRYSHRNENKVVDREFGFEELLHEEADQWEIKQPFMNVYQESFECYITADMGTVQVETAVGRPTPRDARFAGNVVIHIMPQAGGDTKESFIYLDDIVFISERSLFVTSGPVRFVSQDAQMLGRGLQIVYNSELERLEFLKLTHLESLRLKGSQTGLLSSSQPLPEKSVDTAGGVQIEKPRKPAARGQLYKCVFSGNVVIDTPEQLVFARQEVSINDIFWAKSSDSKKGKTQTSATEDVNETGVTVKAPEPNAVSEQSDIILTCDGGVLLTPMGSVHTSQIVSGSSSSETPWELYGPDRRPVYTAERIDYDASTGDAVAPGASELRFYASDVTASGVNVAADDASEVSVPVVITAQKQTQFLPASNQVIFKGDCLCKMPQTVAGQQRVFTLSAPKLTAFLPEDKSDKSFASADIVASGPAELIFYIDDVNDADASRDALPATVTAKKKISFLSESKQVVLEGDCSCSVVRQEQNIEQDYILRAPKITIDFPEEEKDGTDELAADIKHLTADGGLVRLATVRRAGEEVLSGVELKCSRFDYDPNQQQYVAAGPGFIKFKNTRIPNTRRKLSGFSFRKPCWAVVENFDKLRFFSESNRIVAEAASEKLLISYFPVINGGFGRKVEARTGFVEAFLYQTANGQTELDRLTAERGVTYEDKDNQFLGSRLFYDHKKAMMMKVNGDESRPCYLNGALVDNIEYNLKTGRVKARIVGPGSFRLK